MKKPKALKDDKTLTVEIQQEYPMMRPIAFSNPIQDDYVHGGVW